MQGEQEVYINCPYCAQQVSVLVEVYYGGQEYVEDCEVCCSPILLKYKSDGESIDILDVSRNQ